MKKILITGIDGLIGKACAEYFLKKKYIIYGLSRHKKISLLNKNLNFICGDLSNNSLLIPDIDICIHAAAISPNNSEKITDFLNNNVIGTLNLLNNLLLNKCKKIIYTSAVSIYGKNCNNTIDENSEISTPTIYGLSKLLAEKILFDQQKISVICLRLPGVQAFGAANSWLSKVIKKAINNKDIEAYNPNGLFNNAVWIDDVIKFIDLMINNDDDKNKTFLLGAYKPMKIKNILDLILQKSSSKSKINYITGPNPFILNFNKALINGFTTQSVQDILIRQISYDLEL